MLATSYQHLSFQTSNYAIVHDLVGTWKYIQELANKFFFVPTFIGRCSSRNINWEYWTAEMAMAWTRFPISNRLPSCPWLVFNHGECENYSTQTFVNEAKDSYEVASIHKMCNKVICICSHGWLGLLDFETDDCFMLNPFSMEKIVFPWWPSPFSFNSCILTSPKWSQLYCHFSGRQLWRAMRHLLSAGW